MFFKAKVTKIYCLTDKFCKEFAEFQESRMFSYYLKNEINHNNPNPMNDAKSRLI